MLQYGFIARRFPTFRSLVSFRITNLLKNSRQRSDELRFECCLEQTGVVLLHLQHDKVVLVGRETDRGDASEVDLSGRERELGICRSDSVIYRNLSGNELRVSYNFPHEMRVIHCRFHLLLLPGRFLTVPVVSWNAVLQQQQSCGESTPLDNLNQLSLLRSLLHPFPSDQRDVFCCQDHVQFRDLKIII